MAYNISYYFFYRGSMIVCLEIVYEYESILIILIVIILLINIKFIFKCH
jgi:hypothetical protein